MSDVLTSDFTVMSSWPSCQEHPAWSAFLEAMYDHAYGRSALDTAWAWFATGWNCGFQAKLVDELVTAHETRCAKRASARFTITADDLEAVVEAEAAEGEGGR